MRNPVNLGASRNYRRAFELSSGKYFRWGNHDDSIAPALLERCFAVLESKPSVVLAYGKTILIDASGQPVSNYEDQMHCLCTSPVERFRHVESHLGMCNVIYGLMRRDAMKHTALMGSHIASDLDFVAELALYGTYWEIPEPLFFRRIHSAAYSSQKDTQKLLGFHNPNTTRKAALSTWQRLWANYRAIERAPLSMSDKMALRLFLLRMCNWRRTNLTREIRLYLTQRWAS